MAYDQATARLDVRFQNGETYEYLMVPSALYEELMRAESKGQFFLSKISGKFPFRRTS